MASYFISTGKDMSSNAYNGTTGPAFYSSGYGETTLRSATLAGDTLIPVNDASWFEPGMTLAILPGNTDWITVASVDYANNNIVSNRAMSFAHASGAEVSQQTTNPDRDMPDDISDPALPFFERPPGAHVLRSRHQYSRFYNTRFFS